MWAKDDEHIPGEQAVDPPARDPDPITNEAIADRAYAIYCARNGTPYDGGEGDDWVRAEEELRNERRGT